MANKKVVIDPGHGQFGNPYPAANGYYEGTQMWKLGQRVQKLLEASGIEVKNTRPDIKGDPALATRGQTAWSCDMFVSLHSDAIGSYSTDSARGVSCYYSIMDATKNKKFAEDVTKRVSELMDTRCRGAMTRTGTGGTDYYGVIRSAAYSGCKAAFLIEHGFHSSPSDVKYLISDAWLDKIAEADAQAICSFLGVTYKSSGTTTATTTPAKPEEPAQKYTLLTNVPVYVSADAALRGDASVSKTIYEAGEYYIYKEYRGAYNITKKQGTPGGWINPVDNIKDTPDTNVSNILGEDVPSVEYNNVVIKATLSKSGEKAVKDAPHFKYKDFADLASGSDIVLVNKELVKGFEALYDYLNLSKIDIVLGNRANLVHYSGNCRIANKHANGFGADIICKDANGNIIPSGIICCVAQQMGFKGIMRLSHAITHLDIRKPESATFYDEYKNQSIPGFDFFEAFNVRQADIDVYVNGISAQSLDDLTIMGKSSIDAETLTAFVRQYNPDFDDVIARSFIEMGEKYGIRGDVALCQSCIETGYFKYEGSAVTKDQHNYCGLGVTSNGVKGCEFETVEKGVEAQMQHLYAYATDKDVPEGTSIIDPRFKYVTRGCAPKWTDLSGKWSVTSIYGSTILSVYKRVVEFSNNLNK